MVVLRGGLFLVSEVPLYTLMDDSFLSQVIDVVVQGHLTYEKTPPPLTLQRDYT